MKTIERNYASEEARCLSAHELATLLLLHNAPVEGDGGEARVALTAEGNAMLRVLGAG
jgi:hypothetical protein